jgi:hypothetical protein
MGSQYGSTDLPRYWFQIGKETIWDYPKDFLMDSEYFIGDQKMTLVDIYPYDNEISAISNIIREYIDTPKEIVFEKVFERDKWGLTDMLKASDRRIGKERLKLLNEKSVGEAVHKIIAARLADGK